ncbi:hypothetical protein FYK55_01490 [Roseiconus nitratireducens]|uniref:Uncharacterized protein n=2 Tax=Roseiconus nitratireducens TaxID=2605748 RepID=A0A5M6DHU6_9BACT|nr:hypothetical protein FYK55_01490 [Roseiconus nitratireducens]
MPLLLVARLRLGRAIRNLYDGVMAGESWAIVLAMVLGLVVLAAGAYIAFQAYQEASDDSEDVGLSAEEKNLMNRF